MSIVSKVFFDIVENIQCMVPPMSCHDHCYLTKGPLIYFGPWTRSWQCTVWHCFPMGTGNFTLINTWEVFREVHLHHCCVGICCCRSQLACIICFCLQFVNNVMQQKLCEILKSWQQIFKGAFLFIFLCPTVLTFFPLIPCGCCSTMFLVDFIQIVCLEFSLAKYTVWSYAIFVSGVANTWLNKLLTINRKVLR